MGQSLSANLLTNDRTFLLTKENQTNALILVVEDIQETRDGLEKLLKTDGYCVSMARDEQDATDKARVKPPDLILVSLAGLPSEVIEAARRIRERADVEEYVPVVIFCADGIVDGDEVNIGQSVYLTRPDNFNQLRRLLVRLLLTRAGEHPMLQKRN
jgi:DNA-binding response OmpR family regulator